MNFFCLDSEAPSPAPSQDSTGSCGSGLQPANNTSPTPVAENYSAAYGTSAEPSNLLAVSADEPEQPPVPRDFTACLKSEVLAQVHQERQMRATV